MDSLDRLLKSLLFDGRIALHGKPRPAETPDRAIAVLRSAYEAYRLQIAGSPVPFDAAVAAEAGALVIQACWALVNRDDGFPELERTLTMSRAPASPSEHLSADLTLHFLPQIYQRARAIDRNDPLPALLANVLRQWPLSGVLCNLDDGPTTPLDLGDHDGLMLLYAERWARHENPAWRPAGRLNEYVEMVLHDSGRLRPVSAVTGTIRHG